MPSFDRYPFALPAVYHLDALQLHPQVTFFVGENGSGKSTLLEAIAVAWGFNPQGGTKNFRFGTRTSHSELERYLRLSKGVPVPRDGFFLRAESFFNVATEILCLRARAFRRSRMGWNRRTGRSLRDELENSRSWRGHRRFAELFARVFKVQVIGVEPAAAQEHVASSVVERIELLVFENDRCENVV